MGAENVGYFVFSRIWSALAARRQAMLEAEAFVLRYGAEAEAFAHALAADAHASDESRRHYARVAVIARQRYEFFRGLDTATRYTEAARWRSRPGALIP